MKSLALVGARGYTGAELVALAGEHPQLGLVAASSRAHASKRVADIYPGFHGSLHFRNWSPVDLAELKPDACILALPNGLSEPFVAAIDATSPATVIVDLSADHRFDPRWCYCLPETARRQAKPAGDPRRIANPGCYATAMQLALHPVRGLLSSAPVCFGVSGFSGAGTTPSPRNDPDVLHDNLLAYRPIGHVHEQEVSRHLGHPVRFLPHVAGFFRGINMTISARLREPATLDGILERYRAAYANEPLVHLLDEPPQVARAVGKHSASIGGFTVSDDGRELVVFATLDNLLKGAATQAMQNLNNALGLPELCGIEYDQTTVG